MGSGIPAGAIVSIVIGALIVVFWIVMVAVCCYKRTNVHNQTRVLHPSM